MAPHLGLQRIMIPSAQVSSLTTGSITLPSAKGTFTPPELVLLGRATADGTSTSLTISGIEQAWTNLEIHAVVKTTRSTVNDGINMNINGVSSGATGYYYAYQTNGTTNTAERNRQTLSGAWTSNYGEISGGNLNYFSIAHIRILDYSSTKKKHIYSRFSHHSLSAPTTPGGAAFGSVSVGWDQTSPVTSLTFTTNATNNWANGSIISVYGSR